MNPEQPDTPTGTGKNSHEDEVDRSIRRLMERVGDDECTEVVCNGPAEVFVKVGGVHALDPNINFGSVGAYHDALNKWLLREVDTTDRIDAHTGLVEGQLEMQSRTPGLPPTLARVHIIGPPAVNIAKVTIAKKARHPLSLLKIVDSGAMTPAMAEFLKAVSQGRSTVVVSGPTGAGKSTLLQALTAFYDPADRVIVVEDTPELRLELGNTVYLQSTPQRPGLRAEDNYTLEWFVRQANRMRMDRLLVGECRGAEFAEWLTAANSGAEGSATTIHANDPRQALSKMQDFASIGRGNTSETVVLRNISRAVDVIVQTARVDRRHVVTHIEEVSDTVMQNGMIATSTLFGYDRRTNQHQVLGRPSEKLTAWLAERGIPIQPAWFSNIQRPR